MHSSLMRSQEGTNFLSLLASIARGKLLIENEKQHSVVDISGANVDVESGRIGCVFDSDKSSVNDRGSGGGGGGGGGGCGVVGAAGVSDTRSLHSPRLVVRRIVSTVFKVLLLSGFLIILSFLVWYYMGLMFLVQIVIVAVVAYLTAGGGYKWLYLLIKTGPRDLTALQRYLRFLFSVRLYSRQDFTVADIFRRHASKYPNKVAFIFEDKEYTAQQVEDYSNQVANVFKALGFKKGDSVALMLENRPEFVCIWLGLSKIGVITALINYNLRQNSLSHSVVISNAKAFIFGEELMQDVREVADSLKNVQLFSWTSNEETKVRNDGDMREVNNLNSMVKDASSAIPVATEKIGFHDKLVYIYTSGTTGLPKAAVITNARYVFLAGAIAYQVGFRNSDRFYTPLPLYHTAGGAMAIGQALIYGATVVIRKKFSASQYFIDVVKYKCTVGQYIGEMCRYMLSTPEKPEDKNHNVRLIFGNGLRPQIWNEFVTRFNIPQVAEFYGATEGNANIANIDNRTGAIGFVSRLIPSIYPISIIRVDANGDPLRNADGLCMRCKPGEPGVFIGKIIPNNPARAFLGYINEKESEKKIVRDVFAKGDSAFLSGDILVSDDLGYLYFKDRTGDTFRWKGENVSTSEVEGVVSNAAAYRDCVVYGVEVSGSEGRAGMAAILDPINSLDLELLAQETKKHLPSYARPLFIRALNTVEMTGTYKLKKLDLQAEGYNPNLIKDNLFYLSSSGKYLPLTQEVFQQIQTGQLRF